MTKVLYLYGGWPGHFPYEVATWANALMSDLGFDVEETQDASLFERDLTGYDLLVIAEGRTLQAIATFIAEKLASIQGVISTATHFRLKVYKENGSLLHREKSEPRLAVAP